MDKKKLLKVAGKSVKHALGFGYDGCHKIYVAETAEDVRELKSYGYDEIYPMSELERIYSNSCYLRFISWVNINKPNIVPQGEERVTFEYNTEKRVVSFQ